MNQLFKKVITPICLFTFGTLFCQVPATFATEEAAPSVVDQAPDDNKAFLTAIFSLISKNNILLNVTPQYNNSNSGYYKLKTKNDTVISILVDRDMEGDPTALNSVVYNIDDTSSPTGKSSLIVQYNIAGDPERVDFGDLGFVNLSYSQANVISSAEINIPGDAPMVVNINKTLDSTSCLADIKNCVPVPETQQEVVKSGQVTLVSNVSYTQNDIDLRLYTTGKVNDHVTFTPTGTPIAAPTFDGTEYTSVNNYEISFKQSLPKETFISNCTDYSSCGLGIVGCILSKESSVVDSIDQAIHSYLNSNSLPQWKQNVLTSMSGLLNKANPQLLAAEMAEVSSGPSLGNINAMCAEKYKQIESPTITVNAISQGSISGLASVQDFNVEDNADLPDLTIEKLACQNQIVEGRDEGSTEYIELGSNNATFTFNYNVYAIPDRITVWHGNHQVLDTGCGPGQGSVEITLDPNNSPQTFIRIVVIPLCGGGQGTKWDYSLDCPL